LRHWPNRGAGQLKIIAANLERAVIQKILVHLGLNPQPPPRGRARDSGQEFAARAASATSGWLSASWVSIRQENI
jgi:hypothetical protein